MLVEGVLRGNQTAPNDKKAWWDPSELSLGGMLFELSQTTTYLDLAFP